MNIITVIPLSRSKLSGTLSYFTVAEVAVGSIVSVPVRSKSVHAVVVETREAADLKTEIKNASYEIRKLNKVKAVTFFPSHFIEACKVLAEYYATSLGPVIQSLVSEMLLDNANAISPPLPRQSAFGTTGFGGGIVTQPKDETFAVQGDTIDRTSTWRSLVRQEFARKKSVVIYVPTAEDASHVFADMEKGIEGYIFTLHTGLTKKKLVETWTKISETAHPIVTIATPTFSVLPRSDFETVIIERENSRGWISQRHPYLDARHALETIARKQRQTVYLADSLLRTETLYRVQENEISQGSPFKWRSVSTARDMLVDMKNMKQEIVHGENNADVDAAISDDSAGTAGNADANQSKPKFRVLSPEIEVLIERNRADNGHLFILVARRGLSTITVCDDCETIVTCKNCSAPVVLHTSKVSGKNFFMCHKCGERRSAVENCVNCDSWRLTPLGIGIDLVRSEIEERLQKEDVFKIDADATTTDKQISDVMEKFRARPGSILIGTELALNHLRDKVNHVAVVTIDSLFALPDFRIQEKIMYMLVRLRQLADQTFLVQTRRPEETVFEYGLKGNLSDFHRETLSERKQFHFPPFSLLIKISLEGKKDAIAEGMAEIRSILEPAELNIFPAFTATVRGNSIIHGLLVLERHTWPDADLIAKLRALPLNASIKIDPESLL